MFLIPLQSTFEHGGQQMEALTAGNIPDILFRLLVATLLGSLIAFHPQRLRRKASEEINWDMIKSQILICNMGVILVPIIGTNLALAFALAGLGSFIRFRAAVSNPLDGAIIFVQVLIGMACGRPDFLLAAAFTAFIFALLFTLNIHSPRHQQLWEIKTQGGSAEDSCKVFESLALEKNFRIVRLNVKMSDGVFTGRFRPPFSLHVPDVDQDFRKRIPDSIVSIRWNRLE